MPDRSDQPDPTDRGVAFFNKWSAKFWDAQGGRRVPSQSSNLSPTRTDSATHKQELTGGIYSPRRHEQHEEKRDCGVVGLPRLFSHPWHAFFLKYCTQRRKDNRDASSIWSCLDCNGHYSCRTLLPSFFFVLFVAFVVKQLVAVGGCSKSIVDYFSDLPS